jgi:ATP-dependent exoDNAse (exonuclease V) beta subunit
MNARGANEQARLLYVAMTRARQSLHVSGAPKVRADGAVEVRYGTLLRCLWPVLNTQFEMVTDDASGEEPAPIRRLRRLKASWSPPALPQSAVRAHLPLSNRSLEPPEFSWVGETSRHIGTVVHKALELFAANAALLPRETIAARADHLRMQLRRHGVPERDLDRAVHTVQEALVRTLDDERGRWIFSSAHREAKSELALTGIAGGELLNVIIDRTFVDERGTRWVIDFKTSRHEGSDLDAFLEEERARYRPQLERNATLARALGSEPVKAALYFPLLSRFCEL